MIEQLISRVFYARNLAHFDHWRTKSYAQHKALGKFYDEIIEALDALVEAHQGLNGLIGNIPAPADTAGPGRTMRNWPGRMSRAISGSARRNR